MSVPLRLACVLFGLGVPVAGACVTSTSSDVHVFGDGSGPLREGSGVERTETRRVDGFRRLRIVGGVDVAAAVGGAGWSAEVTADDNLLESITTEVRDDALVVSMESGRYAFDVGPEVRVTLPELTGVEVVGPADVTLTGLDGGALSVVTQGSGDVEAEGRVERLEARVLGSGELELEDLVARVAHVRVEGSGDVEVHATEALTVEVRGSGDVEVHGDPPELTSEVRGSGTVRRD